MTELQAELNPSTVIDEIIDQSDLSCQCCELSQFGDSSGKDYKFCALHINIRSAYAEWETSLHNQFVVIFYSPALP